MSEQIISCIFYSIPSCALHGFLSAKLPLNVSCLLCTSSTAGTKVLQREMTSPFMRCSVFLESLSFIQALLSPWSQIIELPMCCVSRVNVLYSLSTTYFLLITRLTQSVIYLPFTKLRQPMEFTIIMLALSYRTVKL